MKRNVLATGMLSLLPLFTFGVAPAAHAAPMDAPLPNCNTANPACAEWRATIEYLQSMTPGSSTGIAVRRQIDPNVAMAKCLRYYETVVHQPPVAAQRTCQAILAP